MPFEHDHKYREWLIETVRIEDEILVTGRKKLKPGLRLPYLTGYRWQERNNQGSRKLCRAHHVDFSPVEDAAYAAELCWVEVLQGQNAQVAAGAQYCVRIDTSVKVFKEEL